MTLAGDVICLALPGGGGFGDPRARDPQRVLHDVLGVAIDADLQLNLAETQRLRAEA